ncbi:MAG: hypothetical protein ACYDBH_01175 [Acidobacteriaceae bacterium]
MIADEIATLIADVLDAELHARIMLKLIDVRRVERTLDEIVRDAAEDDRLRREAEQARTVVQFPTGRGAK